MNSIIKKSLSFLSNPLFTLRIFLTILICKNSLEGLNFLIGVKNSEPYSLSLTWVTSLLPKEFLVNDSNYEVYFYLIVISTLFAVVGLMGRLSLLVLSVSGIIINGMVEGVGIFDHNLSMPSQLLLMLAFLPGTLSYSLDKLIISFLSKNGRSIHVDAKTIKFSTNAILLVVVFTYFTAGVSKIRYGGFEWLDGSTLSFYIQDRTMDFDEGKKQILLGRAATDKDFEWKGNYNLYSHTYGNYQTSGLNREVNAWLGSNKFLIGGISVLTVILELCGFIVFINPRLRNIYLLSVIAMHSLIGFTMGLRFTFYRVICVFLIDWKSVYKDFAFTRRKMKVQRMRVVRRFVR